MSLRGYDIQGYLGRGNFGEVYLGRNTKDGKLYAVKKIMLSDDKTWNLAEHEARLLSDIEHCNIVSYKESFVDQLGCLHMISKFVSGGDLACEIEKRKKASEYLSEYEVMAWSVQIFMALKYLHERGIFHRNLKPQNIFLNEDRMIKVGDLGISKVLETRSHVTTSHVGTPSYMSPELIAYKPYTHKSDIWSLGCCMYEMVTFRRAFEAEDMVALELKILYSKVPRMPLLFSKHLRDLIKGMLEKHSKLRPGIKAILKNEYVKKHIRRVLDEVSEKKKTAPHEYGFANEGRKIRTVMSERNVGRPYYGHCKAPEGDIPAISSQLPKTPTDIKVIVHKSALSTEYCDSNDGGVYSGWCEDDEVDIGQLRPIHRSSEIFTSASYDPHKYADTMKYNSQKIEHCHLLPRNILLRDSGYHSDAMTVPVSPLDASQVPLYSSTRFYPTPTLRYYESAEFQDECFPG